MWRRLPPAWLVFPTLFISWLGLAESPSPANRLAYLDSDDPFYVGVDFPKLTTPQWVGESEVEAVVTLGIDDMSQTAKYETFLRPILDRLKRLDGRAPLSIFCTAITPDDPQLQVWLREGVTFEVHTLSHPCPILAKHDFAAAEKTFHGGVDLLNHVPGNTPVAFRTPCCDSINSPSPRVYAELFARTNAAGQFLRMDSSVVMLLTTNDPALPRDEIVDPDGRGRFTKYVPFPSFVTTVENYPYPWVIGGTCWEVACMAPSDWEAQNILGSTNATMVADWKAGLDAVALKQGNFNFVFHPHGWSASAQLVEFIDYAAARYGPRVRFLNYREANERLTRNLCAGQPLRAADGSDNGVLLLDLNHDGFLDVVIGNDQLRRTRIWHPETRQWAESDFPTVLVGRNGGTGPEKAGVRFGVVHTDGRATMLVRNERVAGAWNFDGTQWREEPQLLRGLELDGEPVFTSRGGRDRGVRFRDVDGDGVCELLVSNESQNACFHWNAPGQTWVRMAFALPPDTSIVNALGEDNGLRFADLNDDGHDDIIFSNEDRFSVWLYVPEPILGWGRGWTRQTTGGTRAKLGPAASAPDASTAAPPDTPAGEIPPLVRPGPHRNNGAWLHSRHLWLQNEDTAHLPNLVDRRSFDDLLRGRLPGPKTPEEALASFRVRPGFHVELVAAEPLVRDPVAFDWGADGRLWVVEMRDYPLGVDGQGKPGGVVKFLEDTDGDGRYDRATEFLREVNFPTAVIPWGKGVIISAAPDIFYAEDTDGDGRADHRRVLFTGFKEGNQQHRVNGFALGLDGWIYGANGDSGGQIRRGRREEVLTDSGWRVVPEGAVDVSGAETNSVSVQRHDFRFRPDTGEFEAIEGQTQYGRARDDWGNWFGNANYAWLWHYPLPARYVARNPDLAVRDTRSMLARYDGGNRIFPASAALPRPNVVGEPNTVTSACSPSPYRDELFGPDFATSILISEPSENLIHREVLADHGATFTSHRAAGEETTEFLASLDNWFRPVQLKTGPDGALYVADMYRQTIEHPEWIPQDVQQRINLRAGEDLGRIYRVVPDGAKLRPIPRLDRLDTAGLVAALDSPNGWQRDTAMRLLTERRDLQAAPSLKLLVSHAKNPKVRLQALATLGVLGQLDDGLLVSALRDEHSAVRIAAIQACEPRLRGRPGPEAVVAGLFKLTNDPNLRVVFQLALSLGELPGPTAGAALVQLSSNRQDDELLLNAVLSSAGPHVAAMLASLEAAPSPSPRLLERLINLAAAQGDSAALARGMTATLKLDPVRDAATQFAVLASLMDALDRKENGANERAPLKPFARVLARARTVAFDPGANESMRLAALRVFGRDEAQPPVKASQLVSLLEPQNSLKLQQAALAALQRSGGADVAEALLGTWPRLIPSQRSAALDVLLNRPEWTAALLGAVEGGNLAAHEFSATARQKLLQHSDAAVRERVGRLFAVVKSNRQSVVEEYAAVRNLKGDPERGHAQFSANCTPCHRLQGEGTDVGPDLGAMADKSVEALLIAILDPNRAVEERYLGYSGRTTSGREFTGLIASESPNSLTLRAANGTEEEILRADLRSLTSTRRSLMPEGFEHSVDPPAMADLIAYVTASGPRPKEFAGNHPEAVGPDSAGVVRLLASTAEIFGDSLIFEPGYRNLGYWQSANDHADWMFQIPSGGDFDLWLDWARPDAASPAPLQLQVAGNPSEFAVPGTGSWDAYRQTRLSRLHLNAGRQRLVLRGVPPLDGAILDLREVRLVPVGQGTPPDFKRVLAP